MHHNTQRAIPYAYRLSIYCIFHQVCSVTDLELPASNALNVAFYKASWRAVAATLVHKQCIMMIMMMIMIMIINGFYS